MDLGEKYHVQSTKAREEFIRKRELDPDEEVTLTYAPYPKHSPGINALESAYSSRMSKGLNTTRSIFDETAVFNTTRSY